MISSVVKILTTLTSILSLLNNDRILVIILFLMRKWEVLLKNEKKGKKFVSWPSFFNVSASSFKEYQPSQKFQRKIMHASHVVKIVNQASCCYAQSCLMRLLWPWSQNTLIIWVWSHSTENSFAILEKLRRELVDHRQPKLGVYGHQLPPVLQPFGDHPPLLCGPGNLLGVTWPLWCSLYFLSEPCACWLVFLESI